MSASLTPVRLIIFFWEGGATKLLQWTKIAGIPWQVGSSLFHKPASRHYFHRIRQMGPTTQERVTITFDPLNGQRY